jgi:hypothetical protein
MEHPEANNVSRALPVVKPVRWRRTTLVLFVANVLTSGSWTRPPFFVLIHRLMSAPKVFSNELIIEWNIKFHLFVFCRGIRCWWQVLPLPWIM